MSDDLNLDDMRATYDHPTDKGVIELIDRLEQAEQAVARVREMSAHRKEIRLDYVDLIDLDRALEGEPNE